MNINELDTIVNEIEMLNKLDRELKKQVRDLRIKRKAVAENVRGLKSKIGSYKKQRTHKASLARGCQMLKFCIENGEDSGRVEFKMTNKVLYNTLVKHAQRLITYCAVDKACAREIIEQSFNYPLEMVGDIVRHSDKTYAKLVLAAINMAS